jgi:dienelactone hydrolase
LLDSNYERLEHIPAGALYLEGTLSIPADARGIALFPYNIESEQRISYTTGLGELMRRSGLATLLVDLLTSEEKALDGQTGFFRENIDVMQQRIIGIANWLSEDSRTQNLRICYFGAGVTGAAVLVAAAHRPDLVVAVAAAGGRIDLASNYLTRVETPILLLVSENDTQGMEANRQALEQLHSGKSLEIIRGATNIFEDPKTQEDVARLAAQWFERHLGLG